MNASVIKWRREVKHLYTMGSSVNAFFITCLHSVVCSLGKYLWSYRFPGVSISSDDWWNMLTTLIRDIGSFFFQTKKQLSSNNVMNRKYIINPNEIVFMCFHKRPLVLCYAFKLCKHYNLFQSFFHTILYRFAVQNLVMCKFTYSCHLVFPCKSWLCIWLVNWNLK